MSGNPPDQQGENSLSRITERVASAFDEGKSVIPLKVGCTELIVIFEKEKNITNQADAIKSLGEIFGSVIVLDNSVTNTNSHNTNSFNNATGSFNTNTNTSSGKQDVSTEASSPSAGVSTPASTSVPASNGMSKILLPILITLFVVGCFIPQSMASEVGKNLAFMVLMGLGTYACILIQKAFGTTGMIIGIAGFAIILAIGFGVAKPDTIIGDIMKAIKDFLSKKS